MNLKYVGLTTILFLSLIGSSSAHPPEEAVHLPASFSIAGKIAKQACDHWARTTNVDISREYEVAGAKKPERPEGEYGIYAEAGMWNKAQIVGSFSYAGGVLVTQMQLICYFYIEIHGGIEELEQASIAYTSFMGSTAVDTDYNFSVAIPKAPPKKGDPLFSVVPAGGKIVVSDIERTTGHNALTRAMAGGDRFEADIAFVDASGTTTRSFDQSFRTKRLGFIPLP